jgi:molecular chaperone GrpE
MTQDNNNHQEAPLHESAEDLAVQLEKEQKRSEELLARLKYQQADYENLRRRCDRQVQEASQYSNERIIVKLLEVVDELELAIKNAQAINNTQTLVDGVQLTLKRLRKVLEQEGVTPIESKGKPFDPSKHDAVIVEDCDDETCRVLDEVRKGYAYHGRVIRASAVKIGIKKHQSNLTQEKNRNESS